ncbi:MAG: 3'-5' exonuclease [Crocinitomicaceae bacterium]|jgi:DNA polymerase-3 subunit epsilon|nr:3'-5' exonuclease [Crocinitomicaceae bacterium]MDG2463993.1 3'-5' exonuclease [Crocinitomicaceae bacterium]
MKIQLQRPLAVFDLETTGINITQDRIIEIAILKVHPDGKQETYEKRVNPGVKMTEENMAIHGIRNENLVNEPSFGEIATEVKAFIAGCDFGGYNSNRFDVPVLVEEMLRVDPDFDISASKFIDVQNIFHKMEQRTLSAAYQFYCGKELVNAHSALADTTATWEILNAQLEKYTELKTDMDFLSDFTIAHDFDRADFAGRLAKNKKGEVLYNFGKNRGKTVREIMKNEPGYHGWMLNADFPLHTKQILKGEVDRLKKEASIQREKAKKNESEKLENKLDQLQNKFKK